MEPEISTENLPGIKQVVSDLGDLNFNNDLAGSAPIKQTEKAHQLKYVDHFLTAEAEYKLLLGLIDDLEDYDEDTQREAIDIADKSKYDPQYFEKNKKIDPELMKPIQIARTITGKIEAYKNAIWKAEFYGGLISRLRELKKPSIIGKIKSMITNLKR